MFRKLKRVWSHNGANYIPGFREAFPELNKLTREELCDRFIDLKLEFYTEKLTPVKFWTRITLPIAIIVFLVMFIFLPVAFLITGNWSYSIGEKSRLYNWFKALRIV